MVESTMPFYSPIGQTAPVRQTFADAEAALDYFVREVENGRDAVVYFRNPETGEWEE
jgi:hypothetical protein